MMDKLYKAFVDATSHVFQLMLNIPEISAHPEKTLKCDEAVDIAIGIVGDLQGEVVYRFPVATSLNMVKIMSGMEFDAVDVFVTSAISEVANIISGNVLTALSGGDLRCDILPPVQQKPDEGKAYEIESSCCICTAIGEICLEIRLNRASHMLH
ncbi:MAG TPA: chemotaxis protein CheX [Thermoclostridium caenicola]|uniref:Chemotaxis protein CheX n=1 Tax=Thermoclostridium caenicola TaxID=659425 RepID=A0A1M6ALP4_9FIRM|nr:chemotaxis protein CheX [Thermoclostridium caenicola]SHI37386.1 chemotaxis protein CheX [Thermoclostridium caenicola]HOK42245.1 chemotaxis protein CheX [Thermoclostridium caenicola]HOL85385.1 chemotaxis protein CheX [Thermoclostridium caenicola]HPO76081.1 chemotaxis protein CheX [Thermoclostridium caenicola]HPU21543.1 chemotaxis protein CheX [Thermoclostridium caenicola]